MKKYGFFLLLVAAMFIFTSCEDLYDLTTAGVAEAEAEEDAATVGEITEFIFESPLTLADGTVTIDSDTNEIVGYSGTGTVDNTANTVTMYLSPDDYANRANVFASVTFDITVSLGSTTNYDGSTVDLTSGDYTLTVTSDDGTATQDYTISISEVVDITLGDLIIRNYDGASRHSGGITIDLTDTDQLGYEIYINTNFDLDNSQTAYTTDYSIFNFAGVTLNADGSEVTFDITDGATWLPFTEMGLLMYLDADGDEDWTVPGDDWSEVFYQAANQTPTDLLVGGPFNLVIDMSGVTDNVTEDAFTFE